MTTALRIAVTADLHWGHQARGVEATRLLVSYLEEHPPDVLLLAGDIGTGVLFGDCLAQFGRVECCKVLVPGNHDVWVLPEDEHDSLTLYQKELPRIAALHRFHYLDAGSLLLPEADVALVGSINWYDYSWSLEKLRECYPDELHRLESKRFTRGRHNDANFVRWPLDDVTFTAEVVATFERLLRDSLAVVGKAIVVTHHPPFYGLSVPRPGPPTDLDSLLWDAFCGNRAMEEVLARHADRIAFAFCGHTHRERENTLNGIRGYNVGGDYHFKRLLWLEWPAGTVTAHQFGDAE
ncbi:MAG: metallophosphoesterase family protein [Planctomycetes bacterium]|nr:metallophosphoesterase family protein [Planctomycetota bacterium]